MGSDVHQLVLDGMHQWWNSAEAGSAGESGGYGSVLRHATA
jgi:hypothetical protein